MDNPFNPYTTQPSARCVECGDFIRRTKQRGDAFGGRGKELRYCGSKCRQRASRRTRAAKLAGGGK